jgi:hypothetical protein
MNNIYPKLKIKFLVVCPFLLSIDARTRKKLMFKKLDFLKI